MVTLPGRTSRPIYVQRRLLDSPSISFPNGPAVRGNGCGGTPRWRSVFQFSGSYLDFQLLHAGNGRLPSSMAILAPLTAIESLAVMICTSRATQTPRNSLSKNQVCLVSIEICPTKKAGHRLPRFCAFPAAVYHALNRRWSESALALYHTMPAPPAQVTLTRVRYFRRRTHRWMLT